MAIKPDREYRNFAAFNLVETRAAEEGGNDEMFVEKKETSPWKTLPIP